MAARISEKLAMAKDRALVFARGHKRGCIAAGISLAATVTACALFFTLIYPGIAAKDRAEKAASLSDYDLTLSVSHTYDGGEDELKVEGSVLRSVKQAELRVSVNGGDKSRIVIDGDDVYADTYSLLKYTGPYWLGDVNDEDYFSRIYDGVLDEKTTKLTLSQYAMPSWDSRPQWVDELVSVSSILKEGFTLSADKYASFRNKGGGSEVELDQKEARDVIKGARQYAADNAEYIYDHLTRAAKNYGVETSQLSGAFDDDLSARFTELSKQRKADKEQGVKTLKEELDAAFDRLDGYLEGEDARVIYRVEKDGRNITQSLICENGNSESYSVSLTRNESYKTSIEDIPEKFEDFGVQKARIEKALGAELGITNSIDFKERSKSLISGAAGIKNKDATQDKAEDEKNESNKQ